MGEETDEGFHLSLGEGVGGEEDKVAEVRKLEERRGGAGGGGEVSITIHSRSRLDKGLSRRKLHTSRFKTRGISFKEKVSPPSKSMFNRSTGSDRRLDRRCGEDRRWMSCLLRSRTTGFESLHLHPAAVTFSLQPAPAHTHAVLEPPPSLPFVCTLTSARPP